MRIGIYISLVGLILFLSNWIYVGSGLYHEDIKKCNAELVYKLDSSLNKSNILYFSESSNFTFSDKDSCKEYISKILGTLNPAYKITAISKGAIYSPAYKQLIHRIPKNSSVRAIILTINLRSFGINWRESDLETNLSRANVLYSNYPPLVKKFMLSFKSYDNRDLFKRKETIKWHYKYDAFKLISKDFENVKEWDKKVFNVGVPDQAGNKDQAKTNLACHFIKNYAFSLNEQNPNIRDLDDIISFCNKNNIKLIFNLLPENFEKARELCGIDLEILMRANVAFLENRYRKTTLFVNNFDLLGNSFFIDKEWPTEHYYCLGRTMVAEKINEKLKSIYE